MAATENLDRWINDYADTFRREATRFVCPITLRECDPSEIVNGHILPEAIQLANRRQVPQYCDVDHFYGTTVEPAFIEFVNVRGSSPAEWICGHKDLEVEFDDGSVAKGFTTRGRSAANAEQRFPWFEVDLWGEKIIVFVRTRFERARCLRVKEIRGSKPHPPSHSVAALLKAAHLAMFDLVGYRAIADTFGDSLRRTLASFYYDRADRNDTPRYFKDFQNAVKLVGHAESTKDCAPEYRPLAIDTLKNREVLLHFSGLAISDLFALSLVFQVNYATIAVTIPQAFDQRATETIWRTYQRLLAGDRPHGHSVHRAVYEQGIWRWEKQPLNVRLL